MQETVLVVPSHFSKSKYLSSPTSPSMLLKNTETFISDNKHRQIGFFSNNECQFLFTRASITVFYFHQKFTIQPFLVSIDCCSSKRIIIWSWRTDYILRLGINPVMPLYSFDAKHSLICVFWIACSKEEDMVTMVGHVETVLLSLFRSSKDLHYIFFMLVL